MNAKRIYWTVCASVLTIGIAAWATTPWLDYTINLTESLPGTLYVVQKGCAVQKGNFVAYRWKGGATYPAGTTFIKIVAGVPGDMVVRQGRSFWVNDKWVGIAKTNTKAGVPVSPAVGGVIPPGEYFVSTPSLHSLDSRYSLSGNVKQHEIIGRAYEVF